MPKALKGMFGGGGGKKEEAAPAAGSKPLYSKEQVAKATQDYTTRGTAKWNQVLANMGAGGGTGVDLPAAIGGQAKTMGEQLAGLTSASGFTAESPMDQVMKQVEGGINARYPVF